MSLITSASGSFLIILSSVLLYGAIHSLLASLGVRNWVHKQIGSPMSRLYRLFYNVFAVLSFLPVMVLVGVLPDRGIYQIQFPWLVFSLAGQGMAILVLIYGLLQTGIWSFLGLQQLVKPNQHLDVRDELVVYGLYRWVRHPLYSAGLLFIWFTPLMTSNVLALNLGLSMYILIGAVLEERKMIVKYGEAYRRYSRQTPMLIPWPRSGAAE
jgi:protein-S-isoprenylcysteine O-methyltransferase Ste14